MVTSRCTAARLALAAGSLHGASVVCVKRIGDGGVALTTGKALYFNKEALETFNWAGPCHTTTSHNSSNNGASIARHLQIHSQAGRWEGVFNFTWRQEGKERGKVI